MSNLINFVANPSRVFTDHIDTLRTKDGSRSVRAWDIIVLYGLPLVFGFFSAFYGKPTIDVSAILSAVAVYTGLIFNLAFHVFDKSLSMRTNPFEQGDAKGIELVDDLFSNVNYTVVIGLVSTGVLICASLFEEPEWFPIGSQLTVGIVASLLAHMFLMSGMVIKRFRALRLVLKP